MLVIRREQMEAFTAAKWREFASLAVLHCRARHPEACAQLSDAVIQPRVEAGIQRARTHGFEQARDLIRYLDLLFRIGPEADREDWIAAILRSSKYAPGTRVDIVFRTLEARSGPEEPEAPAHELPDATWPEPAAKPVPPPPKLQPPGPSCMARPPWESSGGDTPVH